MVTVSVDIDTCTFLFSSLPSRAPWNRKVHFSFLKSRKLRGLTHDTHTSSGWSSIARWNWEGLAAEPVSLVFKARANTSKLKRRKTMREVYEPGVGKLYSSSPHSANMVKEFSIPCISPWRSYGSTCFFWSLSRCHIPTPFSSDKRLNWLGSCCKELGTKHFNHGFLNRMYEFSSNGFLQHSRSLGDLPGWDFEIIFMFETFLEILSEIPLILELS